MADTGPDRAAFPLILRLFGPFEVRLNGEPLPRLRTRKGEWLLALLALRHGASVDRGWLSGLLWPASTRSHALRNSLTDLRRALGEEAGRLRSPTSQTLSLDLAGAQVDVLLFDAAVARGDESSLEAAVSLYRGPLLEGCVEEWVVDERQAREQAYLGALERLAAGALARGEHTAAESCLRRVVGVDPLRESAQRALMQTLAAGGSYAAASVTYRELRLLLQRELNSQPDPETDRLFQQLRVEAREKAVRGAQCAVRSKGDGSSHADRLAATSTAHRALRTAHASAASTLTFLFTDIEGSTRLWEQHPDAMRAALACHDVLLRHAIQSHGGEIFKSMGDQCCAAFTTAPDALAAALAAQRALQREAWEEIGALRVRIALHSGTAEEREKDYFGPALNRVARLLEAGHGGQILLSLATHGLTCDDLPEGTSLRDLGEHRLRDLVRPEHVFQPLAPDLPVDFPPLKSLAIRPNNLPLQLTPLVGRQGEVETACELLRRAEVRLLTLTGPGGTGKTRLALQVAVDLLDDFADGVFFVDLAPILAAGLVAATIAQRLGVRETGGQPLLESLKASLQARELLLVLDNFEQVLKAGPLVVELLTAAPGLKVLVTSRAALHVRGEQEFPVPPLAVPGQTQLPVEALSRYAAVELFIQRAASIRPDFTLTEEDAPAVAAICRHLDGLPLAIELAAARIKLFAPPALLSRMESRLKLLTGGAHDLPERQQTLRGAIAWSYDLLNEGEKRLFRRLSVFVGGCTLDAAEAVCSATDDLEIEVLDGVASLVDKSLLRQEERASGEPRFRMLETIREYALEAMAASDEVELLRRRHADYFLALAEEAEPELWSGRQAAWLDHLETELDNLRTALEWCRSEPGGGERELRLAAALRWFCSIRGHLREARGWLESALARAGAGASASGAVRAPVRAKALSSAGILAWFQGDYTAARSLLEEGLAISREAGDPWGVAWSLLYLGQLERGEGNHAAAHSLLEECLAISQEQGYSSIIAWSLTSLGVVANAQGDPTAARSRCQQSLSLFRGLEDKTGIAWSLLNLGDAARLQRDYPRAAALYRESLALFREPGNKRAFAYAMEGLAGVAAEQEQPERAARLFGAAEALRDGIGALMSLVERASYARSVAAARAALDDEPFATAWAAGRSLSLEEAVALALEDSVPSPAEDR